MFRQLLPVAAVGLLAVAVTQENAAHAQAELCPKDITAAFPECTALAYGNKDGSVSVCGCDGNVTPEEYVKDRIPEEQQEIERTEGVVFVKTKMREQSDPCTTVYQGGNAYTYCW